MLQISPEQLESLDERAEERFVARCCAFLRSNAAPEVARANDEQLAAFVRDSTIVAGRHGVTSERGVMKWCLLRLVAGGNFQDSPEVRAFFAQVQEGEHAVRMLLDRLGNLTTARGK
jgi:hypothetical protein